MVGRMRREDDAGDGLDETQLAGPGHSLGAPPDVQLAVDVAVVALDSAECQMEPLRYLLVGESLVEEV